MSNHERNTLEKDNENQWPLTIALDTIHEQKIQVSNTRVKIFLVLIKRFGFGQKIFFAICTFLVCVILGQKKKKTYFGLLYRCILIG